MNYQIIIRPEAENDIEETFSWYEEQSIGLGMEFIRCMDAAIDLITRTPEIYQKVYKEVRRALIRRFPYGLFYLIENDKIIILALLHAKRDPQLMKERS